MIVHAGQDALAPDLAAGLRRITVQAWPGSDERHDPLLDPELFVDVEDGRVVAGLAVLTKDVVVAERRWRAAGLSAVVVAEEERGCGRAGALAAAARSWIVGEHGADVGLLTCDRPLVPLYERAGWAVLPGAVLVGGTVERPFPSDSPGMDKPVLAAWPSGAEAAVRAAFEQVRIPLHPGAIDRLW